MNAFIPTDTPFVAATVPRAGTASLLRSQLERLNAAIADAEVNGQPEAAMIAQRFAYRVAAALEQPPLAIGANAGMYGENGWAPAIDSICWQAGRPAPAKLDLAYNSEARAALTETNAARDDAQLGRMAEMLAERERDADRRAAA